ncbi:MULTISPECIES: endonuclease domain-containing protein [unclassified Mesorhizobium]|uniref:endonuclease domain-containing protein n=1 Tax=unclassified Mesorhizobium TaxID=325217 RepID=UPI0030156802
MRGPESSRTNRARSLRKADNDAERALWSDLKGRQANGAKFTRQLPIGPYFADFACREGRLVVELDGSQHLDNEYDRRRDQFMIAEGWSVLRFWNTDALTERDAVIDTIIAALERRLDPVEAQDLRFIAASTYREILC